MKSEKYDIITSCPEETFHFGVLLGQYVTSGSVIALNGELGSGKTCLTKGIAKGLDVPKDFCVTSPTFAIINEYPGRIHLYHVDLYRINEVCEINDIGLSEILVSNGVIVIEWAEKLAEILPEERLQVSISIIDDYARKFYLTGRGQDAINLAKKILR
ncbi:MAG: tRNA (N6-adenosine(37)-N6)-threonylcarbamoyltransferase complex ATPase TsaE [Desulfobacterales bacterium S7086C20]|nr:MAG: tRNA (N6-adenosine(37)-N6)-threonylcarbamoyltransferase complex ATPase TsaE [Desulfobacterales bacterium S7086C20]